MTLFIVDILQTKFNIDFIFKDLALTGVRYNFPSVTSSRPWFLDTLLSVT